jgi:hypothetical protein
MKPFERINTWVPAKTKKRIIEVAESAGLKSSDVIRIGLDYALEHFERGPVQINTSQNRQGELGRGCLSSQQGNMTHSQYSLSGSGNAEQRRAAQLADITATGDDDAAECAAADLSREFPPLP